MALWELSMLAVALSMDAFAVAVCKGLSLRRASVKNAAIVGAWFGGFQALMPLIGYFVGVQFSEKIAFIDHWIAFLLLALIGASMIREALSGETDAADASLSFGKMLTLALATSIDALAAGVTFAFLQVNVYAAVALIGAVTFAFSFVGVRAGATFGARYQRKAEFAGGVILCLLGVKILVEHLIG